MRKIPLIAVLAAAAGIAATAAPATAATPACSQTCTEVVSPQLAGQTQFAVVPGSAGHARRAKAGDHLVFRAGTRADSNEDFGPAWSTATVGWYCHGGPQQIRGYLCSHDRGDVALEMQWLPGGRQSGLCAGVAAAAAGEQLTLQKCGRSPRTLWVVDQARAQGGAAPLISGAGGAADPLVLSVSSGSAEVLEPESTVTQVFGFTQGPWSS